MNKCLCKIISIRKHKVIIEFQLPDGELLREAHQDLVAKLIEKKLLHCGTMFWFSVAETDNDTQVEVEKYNVKYMSRELERMYRELEEEVL